MTQSTSITRRQYTKEPEGGQTCTSEAHYFGPQVDHTLEAFVYADIISSVCTLLLGIFQTVSEMIILDIYHHSCMASKPCSIAYINCGRMFLGLASFWYDFENFITVCNVRARVKVLMYTK